MSFETEPPDAGAMAERMPALDGVYPWLVAEDADGIVVGYAYAAAFHSRAAYRWSVETTVYVAGRAQRSGVGRLLCRTLLATLRGQGFSQAIAVIALPNDASVRLHETLGFRRAGVFTQVGHKHGRWIDVGYWQCALTESSVVPDEPRRFTDVGLVQ